MVVNRLKIVDFWLYLIIVAFAVSPAFALGEDNRNLFLIALMGFSPLVILRYGGINKNDLLLLLFMVVMILAPLITHPGSMRWSTVMYSAMFCLTFMAYNRLLHNSNPRILTYSNVLKWLIYAYTIVLLIQQFCVLMQLPVFNSGNYNPLTPWKLNSLTSEPSHSARFMGILMYSYVSAREIFLTRDYSLSRDGKRDILLWISFFWTMLTMVSTTAFLFIFIVWLKFLNRQHFVYLLAGVVLIIVTVSAVKIKSFDRMQKSFTATISLDEKKIIKADHSGSYRIVPIMLSAKEVDLSTIDGWLGKGIGYMSTILHKKIPGTPRGYSNGGMMLIAVENGFLAFILFLIFTLRTTIRRKEIITYFFWFLLIFALNINMQMLWCAVLLLYTNKHFLSCSNTN